MTVKFLIFCRKILQSVFTVQKSGFIPYLSRDSASKPTKNSPLNSPETVRIFYSFIDLLKIEFFNLMI